LKSSVPVMELCVVASLFFTVPMASIAMDVAGMMGSHGHQHLPLLEMIRAAAAPPERDLEKISKARKRHQEFQATLQTLAEQAPFVTADPHAID
jgi:hypothetical protein